MSITYSKRELMKKSLYTLIISFGLILFNGCTTTINKYRVTVDAITANHALIQPTSYTIRALGEKTNAKDLRFQRHAQYLETILKDLSYTPSTHPGLAKQTIYFDYGIEKIHEERRVYREPEVHIGVSWGFPYRYYHRYYDPFWYDAGYTTYRTYEKRYPVYNRYIVILAKDQMNQELWRVDASSSGESNNLNQIIPLLIEASKPYIGKSTEKPITITITEKLDKKE